MQNNKIIKDVLRKLCADGLPANNIFETAAIYILEYERLLIEKKKEKSFERTSNDKDINQNNSYSKNFETELKVNIDIKYNQSEAKYIKFKKNRKEKKNILKTKKFNYNSEKLEISNFRINIYKNCFNYFDNNRNSLNKEIDFKILDQKSDNYKKKVSEDEYSKNKEIGKKISDELELDNNHKLKELDSKHKDFYDNEKENKSNLSIHTQNEIHIDSKKESKENHITNFENENYKELERKNKEKEEYNREKEKISHNLITKSNEIHDNQVNEKDISKEKEDIHMNIIDSKKIKTNSNDKDCLEISKENKQQIDNLSENNKILKNDETSNISNIKTSEKLNANDKFKETINENENEIKNLTDNKDEEMKQIQNKNKLNLDMIEERKIEDDESKKIIRKLRLIDFLDEKGGIKDFKISL